MFISSVWDVKEPTHYSRIVRDEVPGVVAVLFSPAEVAGLVVMSLKRVMVYETTCGKRLCRVLEHVDLDVDVEHSA